LIIVKDLTDIPSPSEGAVLRKVDRLQGKLCINVIPNSLCVFVIEYIVELIDYMIGSDRHALPNHYTRANNSIVIISASNQHDRILCDGTI
jgi:hypothetical protein